ncbi:hypothetical protein NEH83_16645 [Streptomyces sp. JUS-F4]|nr:hypothetical protein NEH83_16645 [Streptomyces sp. JUS-F4]
MTENLRPSGAHSTDQDPTAYPYASSYGTAQDGTAYSGTAQDGTAYAGAPRVVTRRRPRTPPPPGAGPSGRSRCWRRWPSRRA